MTESAMAGRKVTNADVEMSRENLGWGKLLKESSSAGPTLPENFPRGSLKENFARKVPRTNV